MQFVKSGSIWAALTLATVQASAQEPAADMASSGGQSQLEEVVVSATKREESMQRVPVSVNAMSGAQLKQSGVVRLQDAQIPSLTVQEGGIGNSVFHPADSAVLSASVDRVWLGRAFSVHTFSGNIGFMLAPAGMIALTAAFGWRYALMVAGLLAFLVVAVLVVASVFLYRSLRRHLGKINFEEERPTEQRTNGSAGSEPS